MQNIFLESVFIEWHPAVIRFEVINFSCFFAIIAIN